MTSRHAMGIDLGTTHSVIAVIDRDGSPRILTTEDGSTTMPSLVWFSPSGPLVGEPAREGLVHDPAHTVVGVKRLLGRRFDHPEVRQLARALPYDLVEAPSGDAWIQIAGRAVSPEEVAALILRELRRAAERVYREPVTRAVLAVPAWFDAAQRLALKNAALIAGLSVMRLVSEPTAAALGHGAHRDDLRRYLVCDLGGGSFDVAAVDIEGGVLEVLATTGDPFLGGDDIDRAIVAQLVLEAREARGLDLAGDAPAIARLRAAAQEGKHALSDDDSADLDVGALATTPEGAGVDFARRLRRDELDRWAAPLLGRIAAPIEEALRRCARTREDIQRVLLVGGATRMPAVREQIARATGREPTVLDNPEEVVAIGAALEVARLDGALEGVLRIDVASRGIMISRHGLDRELVIAQSSVLPTRELRVLATYADDQARLEFDLWESDEAEPSSNRHVGRYAVVDLPPAPAGDVLVIVEFMLDVDGVVRLGASELVSGDRLTLEPVHHAGLPGAEVTRLARQLASAP